VRIEFKDNSAGDPSMFDFYDPIIGDFVNSGVNVLLLLDYESYTGRPQPVRLCASRLLRAVLCPARYTTSRAPTKAPIQSLPETTALCHSGPLQNNSAARESSPGHHARSKALAVHDLRARFVVLALGDPHLDNAQAEQTRSSVSVGESARIARQFGLGKSGSHGQQEAKHATTNQPERCDAHTTSAHIAPRQ
jgi:hypothetical protein